MYILGIHLGHDATACLLNNKGEIVAAVAEERLTRIKYHTGFPYNAIEKVMEIAGITKADITDVAVATMRMFYPGDEKHNEYFFSKDLNYLRSIDLWNQNFPQNKMATIVRLIGEQFSRNENTEEQSDEAAEQLTEKLVQQALNSCGFQHSKLHMVDHHRAHACSAAFTSGVSDGIVITMDGSGDGLCATAEVFENGKLRKRSEASAQCSPGNFYSQVTAFLGFKRNRHEGKITGLAAFGDKQKYYHHLKKFLRFNPRTEQFEFDEIQTNKLVSKMKTLIRILQNKNSGSPYINQFNNYLQQNFNSKTDAKDLAAAVQAVCEDVACEYVMHFKKEFNAKNILLAGGVFANVRVNQKINELGDVDYIYVHQNMGDGGISTGAAMCVYHQRMLHPYLKYKPSHVYFGNSYTNAEIENALQQMNIQYTAEENIEQRIAELIHNGKVVGRFNGAMEYGPRALGNRTIIARPTEKGINDWLNKKLNRTEFMPFAPAVLYEEAQNLFNNFSYNATGYTAQFMTITFDVKPEWMERMQAATHVDGTARPQLVSETSNPSFYKVIKAYHQLSGIPVVINTSYNMHEEPIVATPQDGIRAFLQGGIDYLAIGNFLAKNNQQQ